MSVPFCTCGGSDDQKRRPWTVPACCVLVIALAGLALTYPPDSASRSHQSEPSQKPEDSEGKLAFSHLGQPTALRQRLLGAWRRRFFGEQRLIIRDDGTATVVAWPTGIWRLLLGPRLKATFVWTLQGRTVTYDFVCGDPPWKIDLVRRIWGDHFQQRILVVDTERLVLMWSDGDVDRWSRLQGGWVIEE